MSRHGLRDLAGAAALGLALGVGPTAATQAACEGTARSVYAAIGDSVVSIFAEHINPFDVTNKFSIGIGSGVVIDANGHVLTNAHVAYGAARLSVALTDDEILPLRLVGADLLTDLAVVRFAPRKLEPVPFRLGEPVVMGEEVLALGSPFGLRSTLTRGIVSGLERDISPSTLGWTAPLIQTDAAINPGNSGGPLVDLCGRIVGINAMSAEQGENLGFAIPADLAERIARTLIEKGRVSRPWHGVYGQLISYPLVFLFRHVDDVGLLVETVEPGSPAERMGLRGGTLAVRLGRREFLVGGDVITEVNGIRIHDLDSLREALGTLAVGTTVNLEYSRGGRKSTASAVLPERPHFDADAWWLRRR